MKNFIFYTIILFSLNLHAQDKPGCENAEPKYMTRMPGFFIRGCQTSEYNTYKYAFINTKEKREYKEVSGRFIKISYVKNSKEPRPFSGVQIHANYYNAVVNAKGESLALNRSFFKMKQNNRTVYFQIENAVDPDDRGFEVIIVEVEEMKQDIEVNMSEGIGRDGKIALYGITFDVNKAVLKPESEKALQTVIDYLNANAAEKIIVVGHTDNTGIFANNITLSKERAKAVKDYLITKGKINAARLLSDGVGALCPVATNTNDEGKALNRRVEIVKQ